MTWNSTIYRLLALVDHHLIPMMPRHNLAKAYQLVKSFCKEYDVNYHEADLVDGTVDQ